MPIHIENITSDITVVEGELPLTEKQLETITECVLKRLEQHAREARARRESSEIARAARPDYQYSDYRYND